LILPFGRRNIYVDLAAEAPLAAEKAGRKIAVEVKSFIGPSEVVDLEQALGQYVLYRFLLERGEPERVLFLAVTDVAYASAFGEPEARDLIEAQQLKLFVFDPTREVIVQWIE
jgi:XisH protein